MPLRMSATSARSASSRPPAIGSSMFATVVPTAPIDALRAWTRACTSAGCSGAGDHDPTCAGALQVGGGGGDEGLDLRVGGELRGARPGRPAAELGLDQFEDGAGIGAAHREAVIGRHARGSEAALDRVQARHHMAGLALFRHTPRGELRRHADGVRVLALEVAVEADHDIGVGEVVAGPHVAIERELGTAVDVVTRHRAPVDPADARALELGAKTRERGRTVRRRKDREAARVLRGAQRGDRIVPARSREGRRAIVALHLRDRATAVRVVEPEDGGLGVHVRAVSDERVRLDLHGAAVVTGHAHRATRAREIVHRRIMLRLAGDRLLGALGIRQDRLALPTATRGACERRGRSEDLEEAAPIDPLGLGVVEEPVEVVRRELASDEVRQLVGFGVSLGRVAVELVQGTPDLRPGGRSGGRVHRSGHALRGCPGRGSYRRVGRSSDRASHAGSARGR